MARYGGGLPAVHNGLSPPPLGGSPGRCRTWRCERPQGTARGSAGRSHAGRPQAKTHRAVPRTRRHALARGIFHRIFTRRQVRAVRGERPGRQPTRGWHLRPAPGTTSTGRRPRDGGLADFRGEPPGPLEPTGGAVDSRRCRPTTPPPTSPADVRPATPEEAADVAAMHAANRVAWDEAAERTRAGSRRPSGDPGRRVEPVPRRGGPHRRPAGAMPAGDPPPVRGGSRHAVPAGILARTRWSAWTSAHGCSSSPARLTAATGAPARWVEADVLDVPHDLDGTGDLVYTGRGAIIWLQDLDRGRPRCGGCWPRTGGW